VMRELCGHGVGATIHEAPSIPNYHDPRFRQRLTEGLVITIEPIVAAGSGKSESCADGWTIRTADGSLSAHYEHSIVGTNGRPIRLTAASVPAFAGSGRNRTVALPLLLSHSWRIDLRSGHR